MTVDKNRHRVIKSLGRVLIRVSTHHDPPHGPTATQTHDDVFPQCSLDRSISSIAFSLPTVYRTLPTYIHMQLRELTPRRHPACFAQGHSGAGSRLRDAPEIWFEIWFGYLSAPLDLYLRVQPGLGFADRGSGPCYRPMQVPRGERVRAC